MTAGVLGLVWAGLVLAGACCFRPLPRRLPPQVGACRSPADPAPAAPGHARVRAPAEALGRAVLRLCLRLSRRRDPCPPAPDPATARGVGGLTLASAAGVLVLPAVVPFILLAGWWWPRLRARRHERHRLALLESGLPEVVDLLVLAVGAGANVGQAVAAAGRRGTGPLAEEMARITREVERGARVADALDHLPARAGEATCGLAAALASCERYGAPLGPALERLGNEVRRQRRRRAEEAARKVPVLLLFPLVLCILPAFALLTVAPLVAGALRALRV